MAGLEDDRAALEVERRAVPERPGRGGRREERADGAALEPHRGGRHVLDVREAARASGRARHLRDLAQQPPGGVDEVDRLHHHHAAARAVRIPPPRRLEVRGVPAPDHRQLDPDRPARAARLDGVPDRDQRRLEAPLEHAGDRDPGRVARVEGASGRGDVAADRLLDHHVSPGRGGGLEQREVAVVLGDDRDRPDVRPRERFVRARERRRPEPLGEAARPVEGPRDDRPQGEAVRRRDRLRVARCDFARSEEGHADPVSIHPGEGTGAPSGPNP